MAESKRVPARKGEELKAGGFIPQRQRSKVTVRCKAPGGRVSAERLRKIADVAAKYGDGTVHLSVRMSPEILYVDLEDLEAVVAELAEVGQEIASCGKRYRVSTACGGCEYNPNGLVETQRLAEEATWQFFGADTPHKFKTSFSGCPIDCMRAREMDLGFQGQMRPSWVEENCTGCSLCVKACQDEALHMEPATRGEKAKQWPVRDWSKCIHCGDCVKVCPFEAMVSGRTGHAVYVGGKHGKHPHAAYPIAELAPDEKLFPITEAVMEWYRAHGERAERIGNTLDRVGIDSLRAHLKPVIGEYLLTQQDITEPRWRRVFWNGVADAFPAYGEV